MAALPVYRPQDIPENEGRTTRANVKTFAVCRERLADGGSIALFPEGVSQSRPRLMPVRTGASRIALDAGVPVTICPTALVYEPPLGGRRGTLLVLFGAPFVVNGTEGYASRRAAITDITRRIETELRALLAETDSERDLEALRTLRMVWDQERDVPRPATLAERHRRNQYFAARLAELKESAPGEVEELRAETDAYVRALDQVGIPPEHLRGSYTGSRVARFLLVKLPLLLLTLPLALVAGLLTWPTRHVGDIVALRSFGGMEDVRALCRMLGGALMLIVAMALGSILAGVLWGWWAALGVFVGIPLLLVFYVAWRDRTVASRASLRSFFLLAGASLRKTLQAQRRALYDRVEALGHALRAAEPAVPNDAGASVPEE